MNFDQIMIDFIELLNADLEPSSDGRLVDAPLLAHYTSLANLENIMSTGQVWLSNPLDMNDLEEVRFGVNNGTNAVHRNRALQQALGTERRRDIFYNAVTETYQKYAQEQVLDLYIMCFSEHQDDDNDGRLSMWRGYGAEGKGAALVFDVSKIETTASSPFAFDRVVYASQFERLKWIDEKITKVANFIKTREVPDERLSSLAHQLFNRITLFAIFTKHTGFDEEKEWRLVYLKDRDSSDLLSPHLSYFNGPRGLQPKLKLPVEPLDGALSSGVVLDRIVDRIIIGPSSSSPVSRMTAERMLIACKKENLVRCLRMSSIPYRQT